MPTCSQPKCPIATTGVCLEGHTQGCPHLLPEADNSGDTIAENPATPSTSSQEPEPFRFHSGEKLTDSEASRMMNDRPVKMVLCAGAKDAGKSTFLARIGEMFRDGSFKDFRFAGSKTLCAFERVTWPATITSGAGQPDTKRTGRVEKDMFFHLQIQYIGNSETRVDLLISDLPGEIFPDVVSTQEVCEKQLALARADHLVLFIDCGSMIDNAKRHSEKDRAYYFLLQVKKCRHDPSSLYVTVVFSRWDYVSTNEGKQTHEEFCNIVEQYLRERFESAFGGLRFDRIAARPSVMPATNLEIQAIFRHWLESHTSFPMATLSQNPKPLRDFCAFGLK